MVFSSLPFITVFLPISVAGFWLSSNLSTRFATLWLVLASCAFYGYWRLEFLPILFSSILLNYSFSIFLDRTVLTPRLQSFVLALGVIANLFILFYFKYAAGLANTLGFQSVAEELTRQVILPLGISFFTFTQIGFLIDVKQRLSTTRDLLSYFLFVTFFPHLVAGPILHNREMMPQFANQDIYRINPANIAIGSTIFIIGLAKKVVFADPLAADVTLNFAHSETSSFIIAWYAVAGYSLQIYFDFSGYTDMAIGLARIFNVKFPLNFNSPYKATSIIDYWQRFHITLTRFITMYIFNPVALAIVRWRDRRGFDISRRASATPGGFVALVAGPTLVTMGLAGVWHGSGTQYLVFGLLHGLYITINHAVRIFSPVSKSGPQPRAPVSLGFHVLKVLTVYLAALIAFAFFRAASTASAVDLIAGMAGLHGFGQPLPAGTMVQLGFLFAIVWLGPNTQQIMMMFQPSLGKSAANPYPALCWKPTSTWAVMTGLVAALGVLALSSATEFLYFQF